MQVKNKPEPKYNIGQEVAFMKYSTLQRRVTIYERQFDEAKGEWRYSYNYYNPELKIYLLRGFYESQIVNEDER